VSAAAPERGRILDRGYRTYDGPRRGPRGAIAALTRYSFQRGLGLRRPASSKVLPAISVFIAYVPGIVFVGISIIVEDLLIQAPDVIPDYGEYYGYITAAILVFTAFVAPELLCSDRRDRTLGLYLASPLTRDTYLLAKAMAVCGLLALVTLGPPLFVLVARTVAGTGPEGPGDIATLLLRIVGGAVLITLLHASLSLAVASTTTRRAAASAAIVLIVLGSATVSATLIESGDAPAITFGLNLLLVPFELVQRLYGTEMNAGDLSTGTLAVVYAGWTLLFSVFVWWRYRRLQVTR
jgi:ABC-2 type transport system permease protein